MPDTTTETVPPTIPGSKPASPTDATAKAVAAVKVISKEAPKFNDAFAELDSMVAAKTADKPPTKPPPKPASEKVKISDKKVEIGSQTNPEPWELDDKSPEQKEEKHEEVQQKEEKVEAEDTAQKVETKPAKKPSPVDSLRDAYERSKTKISELEQELQKAKETPREDPEKQSLSERLTLAEKRRKELEDEMRYVAYEKTPEYKEKYLGPLESALKTAYAEVVDYDITDAEGNVRKATPEDFNAIMALPPAKANALAKQLFGDGESAITTMRLKIKELNEAARNAVDSWRKNGSELEKARMEDMSKRREKLAKLWEQQNIRAAEKYPQWFKAEDGDQKGNELLEKGFLMADLAFSGSDKVSPEQMVEVHAAVRNKAAAFDREVYRNKKLRERVKDLELELEAYKKSEPEEAEGKHPSSSSSQSWEDELDALSR
jgi:hypothetical protein